MIARDTPTRKRKPRPKPKPPARGPQGLPIQRSSSQRKVAPPKPTRTSRGPQGLPTQRQSTQRPTSVKRVERQSRPTPKKVEKRNRQELRAQLRKDAAKRRRQSPVFGRDANRPTTFGLSRSRFEAAKARGNRAYERDRANDLSVPKILEVPVKAAKKVKQGIDAITRNNDTPGGRIHRMSGGDPSALLKESVDIAANLPSSVYLAGKAGVKAAKGDTHTAEKLWKDYKRTSAIPAALSGDFKEALKRAEKAPVSTALELSGVKASIGRGAGATMRSGALGRKAKRAASTERPNLRLVPDAKPGEGPEIGRKYSRDVINKAAQRAAEKRAVRKGRDPHVHTAPSAGDRIKGGLNGLPVRERTNRPLQRTIDTRVFAAERVRRARKQAMTEKVSSIAPASRGTRYPLARHRGAVKPKEGAGVQLVAEGTARVDRIRADLKRRRLALAKEAKKLKTTDPDRYALNRAEAKHIRELESLDDSRLARISAAAVNYGKTQADVQARGRRVGTYDESAQSKRFYPALQSHIKTKPRVERRALTEDERKVAARVIERRLRRGKDVPERMAERIARPARERVPVRHDVGNSGIDPRTLEVMARELGITKPIAVRPVTDAMRARGTRAGNVQRRTADGREVHLVYLDEKHGAGAKNSALWHELQHLADRDKGVKFQNTRGLTAKQYAALPTEQRANGTMFRNMDRDLTAPAAARDLVSKRPRPGQPKTLKRSDIMAALERNRRTERISGRKLTQEELEQTARILQRRARRGKSTLSGLPEGGPTLITQRPVRLRRGGKEAGMYTPSHVAPVLPTKSRRGTAFEQGAREVGPDALLRQALQSENAVTATEGFLSLVREFGFDAGQSGKRYASTHDEALAAAKRYPNTAMTPVNIEAFHRFGTSLRRRQQEGVPDRRTERDAFREVWDEATKSESGRGKWILMPDEAVERLRAHAQVGGQNVLGDAADYATNQFKDVVLTTASPASWLFGNVTDLGMRTTFAGITPLDIMRGRKITKTLAKQGYQGEQAAAAITGGGLFTAAEALGGVFRGTAGAKSKARFLPVHPDNPIMRTWKSAVYGLEHAIEELPQYGAVGKEFRKDTSRRAADANVKTSLRTLLRLHDQQIDHYAKNLAADRALEARIQKATEDVVGRWGKVSPTMRRVLGLAPFAQWLGAATRYVAVTLPAHHPIKTAVMAGIAEMTLEERKKLGLSFMLPKDRQVPGYQMGSLPTVIGRNEYGPTLKGLGTSRLTSFGTFGAMPEDLPNFILPQFSGTMNALSGTAFTGERLLYPEWWPDKRLRGLELDKDMASLVAIGSLVETMVPFASAARRSVLEQGRPSEPFSTVLTPNTRKKRNPDTKKWEDPPGDPGAGLAKWASPSVFRKPSTILTNGDINQIERTVVGREYLEDLQKRRKTKPKGGTIDLREDDGSEPTSDGVIDLRASDAPKVRRKKKAGSLIDLRG